MKNLKTKGFTLLELLVVIAIIGLLASIVLIALKNARVKSKDSRRAQLHKQIATALQFYYSDYNSFPSTGGTWICLGVGNGDSCWKGLYQGSNAMKTALAPYLANSGSTALNAGVENGTFAFNYFLYNFPVAANGLGSGAPAGAYLVWYKSTAFDPAECNSPILPTHLDAYWYCYELIGTP